jgi:DNA-directed RNA polymerase subunit N (RpoN/RPB10)
MRLLRVISEFFGSLGGSDELAYRLTVRCNQCGEIIESRIDLKHDLSVYYDDMMEIKTNVGNPRYYCRKTLIGKERCFQRIEVQLTFDQDRKVLDHQITGGELVSG